MLATRRAAERLAGSVLALAGFAVFGAWELANRATHAYNTSIYAISDADEWRYTACSRLVEHGYRLFSQVYSAQPPVLFVALAGGMRVFGDSIAGARTVELIFGVLCLAATVWLAWMLGGPSAGGVAGLLLAASPGFLVYARAVEAEVPQMALMTVALAILYLWSRHGSRGLLVLAGLCLAAAVLTKLFALEAILPALLLILTQEHAWRARLQNAAMFLGAVVLPVLVEFVAVAPADQWRQVVTLHQAVASMTLPGETSGFVVMKNFLLLDPGLAILPLAGLVILSKIGCARTAVFLALWVVGQGAMLLAFHPLFPHHPAILLAGMAVAAGVGVAAVVDLVTQGGRWVAEQRSSASPGSTIPAVVGVLAGVLYLALAARLIRADRHLLLPFVAQPDRTLAAYVDARTSASSLIAVDDLEVAELAHRLVVPPLCDPSNVRLYAGYLTSTDLIDATMRYRPPLVLPISGTYAQVSAYLTWLRQHYHAESAPFGHTAYIR